MLSKFTKSFQNLCSSLVYRTPAFIQVLLVLALLNAPVLSLIVVAVAVLGDVGGYNTTNFSLLRDKE